MVETVGPAEINLPANEETSDPAPWPTALDAMASTGAHSARSIDPQGALQLLDVLLPQSRRASMRIPAPKPNSQLRRSTSSATVQAGRSSSTG